uniref:Choline/carnitine acyltransferase domain-containing protein n=1 Tax=Schistocephalus solidus TaxID=70667 RepID=A0A0X3PWC0_SCHSO
MVHAYYRARTYCVTFRNVTRSISVAKLLTKSCSNFLPVRSLAMDTDVACARFTPFSRSWMKSARLSPDAFVQIGLQLAYARLHPNRPPPATYESGTLRRFRLGRTETIRSCSAESVAFTKAMADDTISDSQKCKILRKAIEQHQRYTKMAVSGNGFDRHLLGLRLIAADSGQQTPSFFIDPTYGTANHFLLSTSQITGRQDFGVSFGPVSPDGYGFCYNLQGHHINLMASAFKSKTPNNSARNLLISFAASLLDMRRLLESSE